MWQACFFTALVALGLGVPTSAALADDFDLANTDTINGMRPIMVPLAGREPPTDEEWESLHDETQRAGLAGLFGKLGDLKRQTISFMDTRYFTPNSAEGTLASYGKMDTKNRFDRYGHIAGVEFDVPQNSWKERYVVNAAALVKLTGNARFLEFAGVDLETAVEDRRQIEVTFIGTSVPKDEAIRRLNADFEALEYLGALYDKCARYEQTTVKLLAGPAPPQPKVVLANVIMLDGKTSQVLEASAAGSAKSVIHGIGGGLKLVKQGGEEITLLSPVVRCYRTYSVEFKTDGDGNLERITVMDQQGRQRQVPAVFDLTPDL